MNRREFLQALACAGMLGGVRSAAAGADETDPPPFGQVQLLHITDTHAQLLPTHYREPAANLGSGMLQAHLPHMVGLSLLNAYGIERGTSLAHALSQIDFVEAAHRYGKMGGYAHLASLIKRLRDQRPGALLLDGGDSWQGSATSLWTQAEDMVQASLALGVDIMTGHWEFTFGADRVRTVVEQAFKGRIEFLAQNIRTQDFGDAVFSASTLREQNGVPFAVIGQAFPYTPVANPRRFTPEWTFGINESALQAEVDRVRAAGAKVVVLLSHNGSDVDIKLASRISGIDAILGGHTHDALWRPISVKNPAGRTLVTNAGAHGKFVGLLEFEVKQQVTEARYQLLPVFSNRVPADPAMQALIDQQRAPYLKQLNAVLAHNDGLLYRRGNFNGSFDELLLDALLAEKQAEIALSPGFRWGSSVLPGEELTRERLMEQTAITYPGTTVNMMSGAQIKDILEDVADNLFNPDPYLQQGGDMVRTGGLRYTLAPHAPMGQRIRSMTLGGKPLEAGRQYKVAGWAAVGEVETGEPIWQVVERYCSHLDTPIATSARWPKLEGVDGDPGLELSQH